MEGLLIEKAQGRDGLDQDALVHLLVEEMQLIGADMLGSELIGGGLKVLGELGDIADITVDGVGREVANLHVFEHAFA